MAFLKGHEKTEKLRCKAA